MIAQILAWVLSTLTFILTGIIAYVWVNKKCAWCDGIKTIDRAFKKLCHECEEKKANKANGRRYRNF